MWRHLGMNQKISELSSQLTWRHLWMTHKWKLGLGSFYSKIFSISVTFFKPLSMQMQEKEKMRWKNPIEKVLKLFDFYEKFFFEPKHLVVSFVENFETNLFNSITEWQIYYFSSSVISDVETWTQKNHKLFSGAYILCSKKLSIKDKRSSVQFMFTRCLGSKKNFSYKSNNLRTFSIGFFHLIFSFSRICIDSGLKKVTLILKILE